MHLTGIFLLFCVSIGTVSSLFLENLKWPPWKSSIFTDPIRTITNEVCSYFAEHPDRAEIAINKINETLQRTNETQQTFILTIDYLNSPDNQEKLIGGTSTCPTFFNEIKDALVADLKNRDFTLKNAQQKALDALETFHDILQSDEKENKNICIDGLNRSICIITDEEGRIKNIFRINENEISQFVRSNVNNAKILYQVSVPNKNIRTTASPDQRYPFLCEFLTREKFPSSSFHMRHFTCKTEIIYMVLNNTFNGIFILIGDIYHKDTDIYASM